MGTISGEKRVKIIWGKIISASEKEICLVCRVVNKIDNDFTQVILDWETNSVLVTKKVAKIFTDGEIAFAIAHEIAHFEHEDNKRTKVVVDKYSDIVNSMVNKVDKKLKESGAGFFKRFVTSVLVGTTGMASAFVNMRAESREYETEADLRAIETMKKVGYNPSEAKNALAKLLGGYFSKHTIWESIASTHPELKSRIEIIEKKIKEIN